MGSFGSAAHVEAASLKPLPAFLSRVTKKDSVVGFAGALADGKILGENENLCVTLDATALSLFTRVL